MNDTMIENDEVYSYINKVIGELDVDAVGLWHLVPAGRKYFNLSGDSLCSFLRATIIELVRHGALPVRGDAITKSWIIQGQYGISPDEIASNIVEEFILSGSEPDIESVWFYRPVEGEVLARHTGVA